VQERIDDAFTILLVDQSFRECIHHVETILRAKVRL